ncbi:hypothetical protein ACFY3U_15565 [Micromonospora sp. NPDC000089]|uniref:hypothetical protein n=1 Tax=unclassified Micromonospora TaxID=2617518 RepID=UPI0036CDD7FC
MTSEAEDRLHGGVLVAAALLVVLGGGWWWREAAPVTGPAPGATRPADPAEVLRDELVAARPGGTAVRVRVGADGRVLEATGVQGELGDPAVGLPWFTDTLWRDRLVLVPGRPPVRRESLADGAAHLFQYRCSGPGVLSVSIWHGRLPQHRRVACDGGFAELELPAQPQPLRLDLAAAGPGAVEVQAQLVAVP